MVRTAQPCDDWDGTKLPCAAMRQVIQELSRPPQYYEGPTPVVSRETPILSKKVIYHLIKPTLRNHGITLGRDALHELRR